MSKPNIIELSIEEQETLIERIKNRSQTVNDIDIIIGLFSLNHWLIHTLKEKSISISRLQTMIFGQPIRRRKSYQKSRKNTADPADEDFTNKPSSDDEVNQHKNNPDSTCIGRKNGRLSHQQYQNKEIINVAHINYKPGDLCPLQCDGRLWNSSPGNIIKIKGQGFAKAIHYQVQKLRCSLCGYLISADLPSDASEEKYDYAFKAQLCMLKYYLGLPFYRIENYQKLLGIPLPASTQWDLIEEVANCVYPVFHHLEYLAAQGRLVHLDDTHVKILTNIVNNQTITDKKARRGTHTTGILSYYKSHQIYLYYSSKNHAGENMTRLLAKRNSNISPIKFMCDALSRNIPKETDIILINCLAHCYRKFDEIEQAFPEKCAYVLEQISNIYTIDIKAEELNYDDEQRLDYHQQHSLGIMIHLKSWLETQLSDNLVEENNSLGSAIKYTLKHWEALTQFLKVPGAPLDNNILERSLKIPIRIRKNAMFFKTEHGAFVGSMLLSLIQTCKAAEVNPVEYLTALQENKSQVFKETHQWLPWCYDNPISNQAEKAA